MLETVAYDRDHTLSIDIKRTFSYSNEGRRTNLFIYRFCLTFPNFYLFLKKRKENQDKL